MRNKTHMIAVSLARGAFAPALLLLACSMTSLAADQRGAIVCRDEMPRTARAELAQNLSAITGWMDLKFDDEGFLHTGSAVSAGGSVSARNLLSQALSGSTVFVLEDASNRADIAFSEVIGARWINDPSDKPPVFVVLIDFADFKRMIGDRRARESFNSGWGVMHEVDHVINDSVDSTQLGRAGDCEDHINQMRRECHLPLRSEYFFTFFPQAQKSEFKTRLVRLAFEAKDPHKQHRYWLMWDATVVGGIPETKQLASARRR